MPLIKWTSLLDPPPTPEEASWWRQRAVRVVGSGVLVQMASFLVLIAAMYSGMVFFGHPPRHRNWANLALVDLGLVAALGLGNAAILNATLRVRFIGSRRFTLGLIESSLTTKPRLDVSPERVDATP